MIENKFTSRLASGAVRKLLGVAIVVMLLLLSLLALPAYPGGIVSFVLFDLSFVAMLALALPKPRSQVYLFFAGMLFLGFWAKLMLHILSRENFIEPVGYFSGGAEEWDLALVVASVAAIGISTARITQMALAARSGALPVAFAARIPTWYTTWPKAVWIASLLAMLALYLVNFQAAFYQTGVNPRLVLPYHLNVPLGWLISIGFALWLAVLIHWEFQKSPRSLAGTLAGPVLEGFVSSTSALSRSFYFLHSIAYFFAVGAVWAQVRAVLSCRKLAALTTAWVLYFAISLALVQLLRIHVYHLGYQPVFISSMGEKLFFAKATAGATLSNQIKPMASQLSKLFVDRWIGLEGVLAVSSYARVGFPMLAEALREDPKKGSAALYQKISKSDVLVSERFTFGTLPGIVGVLFYSGSFVIVFCGTLLITILLMATERAALRFTGNQFLASIMALGITNVVCQSNFPYLTAVYIAQLWVAIAFVWLLQRSASPPPRIMHSPP
jgi:hypothetical protein